MLVMVSSIWHKLKKYLLNEKKKYEQIKKSGLNFKGLQVFLHSTGGSLQKQPFLLSTLFPFPQGETSLCFSRLSNILEENKD